MSASSEARTSSGFTFGAVCELGTVAPSSIGGPSSEPVSISIVMSCSPVRGRSRKVASSRISGAYLFSTAIVTIALPCSTSTASIEPTRMPAMLHRLPLAGRDRLSGSELRLQLELVLT